MQKNNSKKVRFKGFHGIDRRKVNSGNESIYDINNFRICSDGSLKKRSGYDCLRMGSEEIRDIWSGNVNGEFVCVFLAGDTVYSFNSSMSSLTYIRRIPSSSGHAQFFLYKNKLYLSDSSELYLVLPKDDFRPFGYVPLYGKDWPTTFYGEVNEPLNQLNQYARISYLVPEDFTTLLPTKFRVKEIFAVYKNGALLAQSEYTYDDSMRVISVPNIKVGDKLLVSLEFNLEYYSNGLLNYPCAYVFSGVNNSRIIFWSPDKNTVFPSAYVSPTALKESEELFPDCSDLYFPEGHEFVVGDGRYNVRGLARHYDRLLIFTEGETWMANTALSGADHFPIMNINTSLGCVSPLGALTYKNSPFTVGKGAILQWNSDTDELNECNAFSISEPIREALSDDFFKNAVIFKDEYRGEIWVHNSSVSDDVWIYNVSKKAWVRFSGISADRFFDCNGNVGFVRQGNILLFSDDVHRDTPSYTQTFQIDASVTTGRLNFDSYLPKRLTALSLDAQVSRTDFNVTMLTDQSEKISVDILSNEPRRARLKRLHSGRFLYLEKVVLTSKLLSSGQTIQGFEIYAR